MITYECSIICDNDDCRGESTTSSPHQLSLVARSEVRQRALKQGWECSVLGDWFCPDCAAKLAEAAK